MEDLWGLLMVALAPLTKFAPGSCSARLHGLKSDLVFARVPWINPRTFPWRFAALVGVSLGVFLVLLQFREGMPPAPETAIAISAIFVAVELAATLAGFALLGGFLGLRPVHARPAA